LQEKALLQKEQGLNSIDSAPGVFKRGEDMEWTIEPAQKKDCPHLARLAEMASGGMSDFLFLDLVPGKSPAEVMAISYATKGQPHSYGNTIVAKEKRKVIGMALGYDSRHHGINQEMKDFFPADRLEHLAAFYQAKVEKSFYLSTLAVEPEYQGKGVGQSLIARLKGRARDRGLESLSLIVFKDNEKALRVYHKTGFTIVSPVRIDPHRLIPHKGGAYLMQCPVA
jgi:ribosomal protein S18 acetylase RimI-like enzyme